MAVRQFALRLDEKSKQTGDISLKELVRDNATVNFTLSDVTGGEGDKLELVSSRNGATLSHAFPVTVVDGVATATLSAAALDTVLQDADPGDWDFVEVRWSLDGVNAPSASQFHMQQNSTIYDFAGWPPNK